MKIIKNSPLERLYLGTWQFGGQFGTMTDNKIRGLIESALSHGIYRFDTAHVYGKGKVEEILGEVLPNNAKIITKIPALQKNSIEMGSFDDSYPLEHVETCVRKSLQRLRRKSVEGILFHNWSSRWYMTKDAKKLLVRLRESNVAQLIGVSLSDGFNGRIEKDFLEYIDVIEAPYNPFNTWIADDIPMLTSAGKKIILRSIFFQGILLKDAGQINSLPLGDIRKDRAGSIVYKTSSFADLLSAVWKLGTSLTIGMTSEKQVSLNTQHIQSLHKKGVLE